MDKIKLHQLAEKMELRGYAKRTIREYVFALKWFFAFMTEEEGLRTIGEIAPAHITAYHTHLQYGKFKDGRFLTNGAIRQRLNAVQTFFRIFWEDGLLPEDLSQFVTLPRTKLALPKNVPSIAAMKQLIESVKTSGLIGLRDRLIFELLYATGIRSEELLTLTLGNISLSEKTVFIHGKGAKDRIVPIGAWVMPWLLEYLEIGRPKLLRRRTPTEVVFLSRTGRPLATSNLCWLIRTRTEAAGIGCRMTPHSFRHACATHMLQCGADIRYIQELLGHSSLSTTQIYTKVDIKELKKMHNRYHPRERDDAG
jgi:site-specific recombinase XerD